MEAAIDDVLVMIDLVRASRTIEIEAVATDSDRLIVSISFDFFR